MAADNAGRLTTQIIHPVPYGEGKVENVRYIATQPSLPGGIRATSVMINGGQPRPGFTEHFKTIDEKDVIGR